MSDLADLPRPSLASECTESMASRPLDGASAGGMPVGRVEFSPSPPAGFPADAAGAAMLIAKHFKVDPESRIAAAVAAARERIRRARRVLREQALAGPESVLVVPPSTVCKHGRYSCETCGTSDRRDAVHTTKGGAGKIARLRRSPLP